MNRPLLTGAAFLALTASPPIANSAPIVFDFTYTGNLIAFTVPTTGLYQILAFGAQGGTGSFLPGQGGLGGRGAEIGGDFNLTGGEILQIAVGGAGSDHFPGGAGGGGGGGGSFVVGPDNAPLVIAGGGGGGGFVGMPLPGQGGLTGPGAGEGGVAGNGGPSGGTPGSGGGGGGFYTAGGTFVLGGGSGGTAYPDLAGGSLGGGFGGGGGFAGGAGGGGGYSGGHGGVLGLGGIGEGGGGGSFDTGMDEILAADVRAGNGEVMITELAAAVPEPASLALLVAGLIGLMAAWRSVPARSLSISIRSRRAVSACGSTQEGADGDRRNQQESQLIGRTSRPAPRNG